MPLPPDLAHIHCGLGIFADVWVPVHREEAEKRAVWVAWINMEAHYGDPPGQAAMGVFHRALPYNNPKALHLALLSVLERAEQAGALPDLAALCEGLCVLPVRGVSSR